MNKRLKQCVDLIVELAHMLKPEIKIFQKPSHCPRCGRMKYEGNLYCTTSCKRMDEMNKIDCHDDMMKKQFPNIKRFG